MGKNIMIADDSPVSVGMLSKIFSEAGHNIVATAVNGVDAFEIYDRRHREIDLLTLDITMPIMKGNEVLKKIIAAHPGATVVMVSAIGRSDIIQECLKNGARQYIRKPFQRERILAVTNAIFGQTLSASR